MIASAATVADVDDDSKNEVWLPSCCRLSSSSMIHKHAETDSQIECVALVHRMQSRKCTAVWRVLAGAVGASFLVGEW